MKVKQQKLTATLSWLFRASQNIRLRLLAAALIGVIRVVCSLAFVAVSKWMVDDATHSAEEALLFQSSNFVSGALALILLLLSEIGLGLLSSWLSNQTEIHMKNTLRVQLFEHQLNIQWREREQMHTGDVMNRMEEDVRVVANTLCQTIPQIVVTLFQLCAALWFMSRMDVRLALLILCILPVFLCVSKLFIHRLRKLTATIRTTESTVQSLLQESISHSLLLRTLEYVPMAVTKLRQYQSALYDQTMQRSRFTLFSRSMVSMGFVSGYLTVFLWGIQQLHSGDISFGVMTAFLQLVGMIQRPTVDLTRQIPAFIHTATGIDRLSELTAQPKEPSCIKQLLAGTSGIRIKQVTFRYNKETRDVLREFSCEFPPGSHTAIMGETGAGKSTLIRLMLALLTPQKGTVVLYNNATPYQEIPVDPGTRCNFIYIPQGNTLLSGTIRDNLLLGNPQATEENMHEALYTAAADFVYELPRSLDTPCYELGGGLSEGQAQRIAIARGLLRKGSILLLDEFSSALDAETEKILIDRLSKTRNRHTLIFITHREQVLRICHQVIRMERQVPYNITPFYIRE